MKSRPRTGSRHSTFRRRRGESGGKRPRIETNRDSLADATLLGAVLALLPNEVGGTIDERAASLLASEGATNLLQPLAAPDVQALPDATDPHLSVPPAGFDTADSPEALDHPDGSDSPQGTHALGPDVDPTQLAALSDSQGSTRTDAGKTAEPAPQRPFDSTGKSVPAAPTDIEREKTPEEQADDEQRAEEEKREHAAGDDLDKAAYALPGLGLGGGGGGGGTGGGETVVAAGGFVVDAYIEGAKVFYDANGDGVWTDEAFAISDASGAYTLDDGSGKLIALGGTDTQTGVVIDRLEAPDGYSVITPLSTLVVAGVNTSSLLPAGMNAAQLSSFDPQAALSGARQDLAAHVMASGQQVLALLGAVSALVSQIGEVDAPTAWATTVEKLVSATNADGFDVSKTDFVGTVLTSALAGTGADDILIDTTTTILSSSVSQITATAVKDGKNIALARLTQSSMVEDLKALATASPAEIEAKAAAIQTKYTTDLRDTLKADTAAVEVIQSAKAAAAQGLVLKADSFTTTTAALYDASVNVIANDHGAGNAQPVLLAVRQALDIFESSTLDLSASGLLNSGNTFHVSFRGITLDTDNLTSAGTNQLLTARQIAAALRSELAGWQADHPGEDPGFLIAASGNALKLTSTVVAGDEANAVFEIKNKDKVSVALPDKAVTNVKGVDDASEKASATLGAGGVVDVTNAYETTTAVGNSVIGHDVGSASFVYTARDAANPDLIGDSLLTIYFSMPAPTLEVLSAVVGSGGTRLSGTEGVDTPLALDIDGLGPFGSLIFPDLPPGAVIHYREINDGAAHSVTAQTLASGSIWSINGTQALLLDPQTLTLDLADHFSGQIEFHIVGYAQYGSVNASVTKEMQLDLTAVANGLDGRTGENTEASLLSATAPEDQEARLSGIDTYLAALRNHVIDSDGSEFVGLELELNTGWSARFDQGSGFVATQSAGTNVWRIVPQAPETLDLEQSLDALGNALAGLAVVAPAHWSGTAQVEVRAFSAEDTTPTVVSALQDEGTFSVAVTPVADQPAHDAALADALHIGSHFTAALAFSASSADFERPSTGDAGERLFIDVSKNDIEAIHGGALLAAAPNVVRDAAGQDWFRLEPSMTGAVQVRASDTATGLHQIRIRSVAFDDNDSYQFSDATTVTLTVPEVAVPPTVSVTASSNLREDVPIALAGLISVVGVDGRSLARATLQLTLPEGFSVRKDGAVVDAATIAANDLNSYTLVTTENYKGSFALSVTATDRTSTGQSAVSPVAVQASADIAPVALGLHLPARAEVAVQIGVSKPIQNLLASIAKLDATDSAETMLVRLEIPGKNNFLMTIDGVPMLPEVSGSGANEQSVYTLTSTDLAATSITVKPLSGLLSSGSATVTMTIVGSSFDSGVVSPTATADIVFSIEASALAPDIAAGNSSGFEDSAIDMPLAISVPAERATFERVGLRIEVPVALRGGRFDYKLQNDPTVHTAAASAMVTIVGPPLQDGFKAVDFTTLKFVPPANYSNSENSDDRSFTITPYSETISGDTKDAAPIPSSLDITARAEPLSWAPAQVSANPTGGYTLRTPVAAIEDGGRMNLNLPLVVDDGGNRDINEATFVSVRLPTGFSLSLGDVVASTASEVTYRVARHDDASDSDNLVRLQLIAPSNYSGEATLTVKATSIDTSGDSSVSPELKVNVNVSPVADTPAEVQLLTSQVSGQEDGGWISLANAFSTSNALLRDSDGSESLKVRVIPGSGLRVSANASDNRSDASATALDVSISELSQLAIRGDSNVKGEQSLTVQSLAIEQSPAGSGAAQSALSSGVAIRVNLAPTLDGASGLLTRSVTNVAEDQFSSAPANAPKLADLVATAASDSDPGEQILYQVVVPAGVRLHAHGGATLPGGSVVLEIDATTGNSKVTGTSYTIAARTAAGADNLQNFSLVPDPNQAGSFSFSLTPVAREVDGNKALGITSSANLVVTAVADSPLLQVPASARGATDSAISVPVLANLRDLDGSETLTVKVSGITDAQHDAIDFGVSGATLPALKAFSADNWGFETSDAAVIARLTTLTLTSDSDFRGANALHLTVSATVIESSNGAQALASANLDVVTIKPIEAPVITALAPQDGHVGTSVEIPLVVNVPNAPEGYALSVLVQDVPDKAYWVRTIKDVDGDVVSAQVGAFIGDGIWLLGKDEIQLPVNAEPGSTQHLVLYEPIEQLVAKGIVTKNLQFQAYATDPEGGTNAASVPVVHHLTFDALATPAEIDPLILSFSGAALQSSVSATGLRFEVDSAFAGTEHPLYWISGSYTNASTHSGYAFLTKGESISGLDSLYATFDEIALLDGTGGGSADGVITAAELGSSARLWVDAGTPTGNALVESGELLALPIGFKVSLPPTPARPADGGIVPSAEALVSWDGASGSTSPVLIQSAIPYLPAISSPGPAATLPLSAYLSRMPAVTLTAAGDKASGVTIASEDSPGGLSLGLKIDVGAPMEGSTATVKYLIKVEGVPDGAILSAGAFVEPENSDGYWLIVDDQLPADGTISMLLPQNHAGSISLKATPLVSVVAGINGVLNDAGTPETIALTVAPVADQPGLLGPAKLAGDEDGAISLAGYAAASPDTRETAYVDFIDADHGPSPAFSVRVGATPQTVTVENGLAFFRVSSSDLANASLQSTVDNFKGLINLGVRAVSQDGSSYSQTPFTPAEVTIRAVADAPVLPGSLELSPETPRSGSKLLEGDSLTLSGLTVTATDAGETVYFDLFIKRIGGDSPLSGFSGGVQVMSSAMSGYDQYRIEAISSTTAGVTRWNPEQDVKLVLKPYLDGALEYTAQATTTEPSNGDTRTIAFAGRLANLQPVSDIPVTSVAQNSGFVATVVEDNDTAKLAGGANGGWFSASVVSPDADESTTFFIDPGPWATGLAVVVGNAAHVAQARYVLAGDGASWTRTDLSNNEVSASTLLQVTGAVLANTAFRIDSIQTSSNTSLPNNFSLPWHARSTDTFSGDSAFDAAPAERSGTVEFSVYKVATTPGIGSGTSIELDDGGSATLNLPVLSGLGTGEMVSYRMAELPDWLVPSGATLVSSASGLSTYMLTVAPGLTQASVQLVARSQSLRGLLGTEFKVSAVATESSSGDSAVSQEVRETITVKPVAKTPTLLGPKLLQINEGATATLAGVKAFITPTDSEEVRSSIELMFSATVLGSDTVGAAVQATLDGASLAGRSEVDAGKTWYRVKLNELDEVQIGFANGADVAGVIALDMKAMQVIRNDAGVPIKSSDPATLTSTIIALPVADTPVIAAPPAGLAVPEGGSAVISGLSISSSDPSESTSGVLTVNRAGFVLQQLNAEVWSDLQPLAAGASTVSYRIDAARLTNGGYRIRSSGYYDGDVQVNVSANAAENPVTWDGGQGAMTGVPGTTALGAFTLKVLPVANTPIVFLDKSAISAREDSTFSLTVNATSADADEIVSLGLRIVDNQGRDVSGFLMNSGPATTLTGGGSGWHFAGIGAVVKDQAFAFTPPLNYSSVEPLRVVVYASTRDSFGGADVTVPDAFLYGSPPDISNLPKAIASLTLAGVADGFTSQPAMPLQTTTVSGAEDASVILNPSQVLVYLQQLQQLVKDGDGSEFVGIDLQLPNGWSGRAGTGANYSVLQSSAREWRLTPIGPSALDLPQSIAALQAALTEFSVSGPANFSGSEAIRVNAFTAEDASADARAYASSTVFTVALEPVVDTPRPVALGGTQVNGAEDGGWISLAPALEGVVNSGLLADTDGSEILKLRVKALNGLLLSIDGGNSVSTAPSVLIDPGSLAALRVKAANTHAKGKFSVELQAVAVETANQNQAESAPSNLSVKLVPVVDVPLLSLSPATGNEDELVALSMAVSGADPEETFSVTISGLPTDSKLLNTADDTLVISGGSITLTSSQLNGLQWQPPPNFFGPIDLGVVATAREVDGQTLATTSQTLTVNVAPMTDAVELSVPRAKGDEDKAIALVITTSSPDTIEAVSVTIDSIPADAVLRNASGTVAIVNGSATMSATQLSGLNLTPPLNYDGIFTLNVTASTNEGGQRVSVSKALQVTVSPVADQPTLSATAEPGAEDTPIPLSMVASSADTDEAVSVTISAIPTGSVLRNVSGPIAVVNGSVTLPAAQLSGLHLTPPLNHDGTIALSVTASADDNGAMASVSQTLNVVVNPVVVAPSLTVTAASGDEDTAIALSITVSSTETDDALSVTISGIPNEAQLSNGAGTLTVNAGVAVLQKSQLVGLKLQPVANFDGTFPLTVTAIADDNGATASSVSQTLPVTVSPVADTPRTQSINAQLLDVALNAPLIDDVRPTDPPTGDVLSIPVNIESILTPEASEQLALVLDGDAIVAGAVLEITLAGEVTPRTYSATNGVIRIEDLDAGGKIGALQAELLIPKGTAYGVRTLHVTAETLEVPSINRTLQASDTFMVTSVPPALASVSVSANAMAPTFVTNVASVSLQDVVRLPGATHVQNLELSSLAQGMKVYLGTTLLTAVDGMIEIAVSDLSKIRLSSDDDGQISFRARAGSPAGATDAYSRFVDYAVSIGGADAIDNAIDNWTVTTGGVPFDAGPGNDVVQLTGLAVTSGALNGGAGEDALILSGLNTSAVVVDLNLGQIFTTSAMVATVDGFESFVGTAGDDRFFGSESATIGVVVRGGAGNDSLFGSASDDLLEGGPGSDELGGGEGSDRFMLAPGSGIDVIIDFDPLNDRIQLAGFGLEPKIGLPEGVVVERVNGHWQVSVGTGDAVARFKLDAPPAADTEEEIAAERAAIIDAIDLLEDADIHSISPQSRSYEFEFDPAKAINGDGGDDELHADITGSVLSGNAGDDKLSGSGDRDVLVGGLGFDTLSGGAGDDLFVFIHNLEIDSDNPEEVLLGVVNDFNPRDGDRIVLGGFDGAPLLKAVVETRDAGGVLLSASQEVQLDEYSIIFNLAAQRSVDDDFQLRLADFDRL